MKNVITDFPPFPPIFTRQLPERSISDFDKKLVHIMMPTTGRFCCHFVYKMNVYFVQLFLDISIYTNSVKNNPNKW